MFVTRCDELCHGLLENLPILGILDDRRLVNLDQRSADLCESDNFGS